VNSGCSRANSLEVGFELIDKIEGIREQISGKRSEKFSRQSKGCTIHHLSCCKFEILLERFPNTQ